MTPQMGGNLAFQRRQPVRPCHDETVCRERFGACIRKTNYRTEQEDRVSLISFPNQPSEATLRSCDFHNVMNRKKTKFISFILHLSGKQIWLEQNAFLVRLLILSTWLSLTVSSFKCTNLFFMEQNPVWPRRRANQARPVQPKQIDLEYA